MISTCLWQLFVHTMDHIVKTVLSLLIILAFAAGVSAVGFADEQLDVVYDTALSEDGSTLELTLTVENAVGLQSGDLAAAYNEADYEYVDNTVLAPSAIIVVAGKAVTESGLVTCSFMTSADEITADMCDENGDLPLVKYTFNVLDASDPIGEAHDAADDFLMFVISAQVDNANVTVAPKGDLALMSEHETGGVAVPENNGQYNITTEKKQGMPWYYIVIGAVVLVGGAVGVSVIVRKKDAAESAQGDNAADGNAPAEPTPDDDTGGDGQ